MSYVLSTTLEQGFEQTLDATRAALADQGFGILTEIDTKATLKAKLDVDVPSHIILGACRPPLAHAALQAEPSVGVLLPCNVVVRTLDERHTVVEAMDPSTMVDLTANDALADVAAEAGTRLSTAFTSLTPSNS